MGIDTKTPSPVDQKAVENSKTGNSLTQLAQVVEESPIPIPNPKPEIRKEDASAPNKVGIDGKMIDRIFAERNADEVRAKAKLNLTNTEQSLRGRVLNLPDDLTALKALRDDVSSFLEEAEKVGYSSAIIVEDLEGIDERIKELQ